MHISVQIYEYADDLIYNGKLRDIPRIMSKECGPVTIQYEFKADRFRIIQHALI